MFSPTISIIVPVYNVEQYLRRCLDSILAQTFTDWECLLVDDGSPDNSGAICDEYARKDSRFRVFHIENGGVSKARIFAFEKCVGEYVTFIDSDDYITKNAIELMLETCQKYNVELAIFKFIDVYKDRFIPANRSTSGYYDKQQIEKLKSKNYIFDKKTKLPGMVLYLWGKIYKRNILNGFLNCGIDFWYGEDQVILLNVIDQISSFYVSDQYIYYYYHHKNEATNKNFEKIWPAYEKIWEFYYNYDKKDYFSQQLPFRIWQFCKKAVADIARQNKKFSDFKSKINLVYNSEYYKTKVLNNKYFSPNGLINRIMFFMFKHKLSFPLFIIGKIYISIDYK